MLHLTNEWGKIISSVDGTRPAAAFGTAITPVQNGAGGGYSTLLAGASVTHDVFGILINVNSVAISGAARDCLATLGFDPAGGTSFADFVSLLCGQASAYAAPAGNGVGGGHSFYFPLWLRAGTTIGMRASVNSADVTDIRGFVRLFCQPSRPELIWCGQRIEQLGVTALSSTGIGVTAGTAAEGTWTEIGTTTRHHRYYEFGFGMNDGTASSNAYNVDVSVGDATNKKIVQLDAFVGSNTAEATSKPACPMWAQSAAGDKVYARTQVGPSGEDAHSIAVYAMGD